MAKQSTSPIEKHAGKKNETKFNVHVNCTNDEDTPVSAIRARNEDIIIPDNINRFNLRNVKSVCRIR